LGFGECIYILGCFVKCVNTQQQVLERRFTELETIMLNRHAKKDKNNSSSSSGSTGTGTGSGSGGSGTIVKPTRAAKRKEVSVALLVWIKGQLVLRLNWAENNIFLGAGWGGVMVPIKVCKRELGFVERRHHILLNDYLDLIWPTFFETLCEEYE
jgi:hypothetical protein